jgi:hypothetical protein
MKKDSGWNETLSKIGEAHPQSELGNQVTKKTIKQIKTEQVVTKHQKRQKGK